VAGRADEWLAELPGTVTVDSVADVMDRVVVAIASILQVLLLTLALLIDGEVLVRRARSLVPEHLRPTADRAGRLVSDTLGRYFAGSLTLAILSGTYVLTVGLVLGVPLIVLAAIWVAITDLIPQIGGFLGGSLFVTLALTQGAVTGALALVLFVAYMSTENYLIHPAIVGRSVNLSPPTTMLAAIIGGTAAGVPGALVATPLVGSVKRLYLVARHGDDDATD
jgi:putative heme transporter